MPMIVVQILALNLVLMLGSSVSKADAYKVLGKGIQNEESKHVLQLACVGQKTVESGSEGNCSELQFLLTKPSGNRVLVGPKVVVKKDLKKEVEFMIKQARVIKNADEIEGRDFELFPWSQVTGGPKVNLFTGLGVGGVALLAGAPVVVAGGVVGAFAFPLVIDIIRIPFRAKNRILTGEAFVDRDVISSTGALMARDVSYWQFKAKIVKSKSFRRLYKAITETDADYVDNENNTVVCSMKSVSVTTVKGRIEDTVWQLGHRNHPRDQGLSAATLFAQDAKYMLRDLYMDLPESKNSFSISLKIIDRDRIMFDAIGGDERYCFTPTIHGSDGSVIWEGSRSCDNLRNGLTKMPRKFPSCKELAPLLTK